MSEADTPKAVHRRSDALDRVTDGVVSLDTDLQYTYVNRRAAYLLDTDPESLRGECASSEIITFPVGYTRDEHLAQIDRVYTLAGSRGVHGLVSPHVLQLTHPERGTT